MNVCIYKGSFGVKSAMRGCGSGGREVVITSKRLLDELSVFEIFFFQNFESIVIDVMP